MVFLNILNIAASAFYLYLFIILQRMKIKTVTHNVLSLMALALFQWNSLAYFVYNSNDIPLLTVLLPLSCIGMFFVFPLNFHFAYLLSSNKSLPVVYVVLIYFPALMLALINIFYPFSLVINALPDGTVQLQVAKENPLNLVWILYAVTMWFVPLNYYIRYYRHARLNREKKQAVLLIRMTLITVFLVTGEYVLNPFIPGWDLPTQSPVIFSVWIGAMVYAIWKYGFLKISPGLLAEKILDSVEDLVLLYDRDRKRVYQNRKAKAVLGDGRVFSYFKLDPVLTELNPLLSEIDSWNSGEPEREVNVMLPDRREETDKKRLVKMRVKPIFDRFQDPLGLLVTGTIVPKLEDIVSGYRLSKREVEVLEYLFSGMTIRQTAEALFITDRTVKAHISSIYEKTGAKNRVELLNMINPSGTEN